MPHVYIPPSQDARYIEDDSEFAVVEQLKLKNYIRNGGFEMGLDFWTAAVNIVTLTAGKYGGMAAVVGGGTTAALYTSFESATDGTATGYVRMHISFDAIATRQTLATLRVPLTVRCTDSSGTTIVSEVFQPSVDEWTRYTISFVPTNATSRVRFDAYAEAYLGDVLIDNVHCSTEPVDLHIPMPHALAIPIFDYADQEQPYISAAGLTLRYTPLSNFGFRATAIVGLGYESPQHNTLGLSSGEQRLLSTVPVSKDFSITGTISDAASLNVDRKKAALIDAVAGTPNKPTILVHRRMKCGAPVGEPGFIQCLYTGGLGIQRTNNHSQDISLDFTQADPHVYYPPVSLVLSTDTPLASPTNPSTPATFPHRRFWYRYRGQPHRSVRNSGTTATLFAMDEAGGIEDSEGNLWVWGNMAEEIARQNSLTPSLTTQYIARLYKNSCVVSLYSVTHPTTADVRGIVKLRSGDLLIHGRFTAVNGVSAICIARWSVSTGTFGAGGPITVGANTRVEKLAVLGGRIWVYANGQILFNGTSLGSDAECARSLIRTDDFFRTGVREQLDTNTAIVYMESDDDGNLYARVYTAPTADDDLDVYKLRYREGDGAVVFDRIARMDEDSSNVFDSYLAGPRPVRRAHGFSFGYRFSPAGGGLAYTEFFLDITDPTSRSAVAVPPNSLGTTNSYSSETGDITNFVSVDSTATPGSTTNFQYKGYSLSGSIEYTKGKKLLPAVSRAFYRSPNWEIGKEVWVNPYRSLPSFTEIENASQVRVVPKLRLVGGGFMTHVGRVVNETNGSSLAFGGQLAAGEEMIFDPNNPILPSTVVLLDNTGPDGVFSLDPGTNHIVVHINTLWHEVPSGAVSGSNALRQVELTGLRSGRFSRGRVRFAVSGSTLTVSSVFGSGLFTLATASTTPTSAEPSGTLNVLSATESGSSGVAGLLLMYSGTYSGYNSGDLLVPICELVCPTAALTIEKGTI